jgi:hypothetical protein
LHQHRHEPAPPVLFAVSVAAGAVVERMSEA